MTATSNLGVSDYRSFKRRAIWLVVLAMMYFVLELMALAIAAFMAWGERYDAGLFFMAVAIYVSLEARVIGCRTDKLNDEMRAARDALLRRH
jgi:hypothetical protein